MNGIYPITPEEFETHMNSMILGYTEVLFKVDAAINQKETPLLTKMVESYSKLVFDNQDMLEEFRMLQSLDVKVQALVIVDGIKMIPSFTVQCDWDRFLKWSKRKNNRIGYT